MQLNIAHSLYLEKTPKLDKGQEKLLDRDNFCKLWN